MPFYVISTFSLTFSSLTVEKGKGGPREDRENIAYISESGMEIIYSGWVYEEYRGAGLEHLEYFYFPEKQSWLD